MEFKVGDRACTRDDCEAIVTEVFCVDNKPILIFFSYGEGGVIAHTVKGIKSAFKYIGNNNFEKREN